MTRGLAKPTVANATACLFTLVVFGLLCTSQLTVTIERVTSTSGVRPLNFVVDIPRQGGSACQAQLNLPTDASKVRVVVGTFGRPGPPLRVSFSTDGVTTVVGRRRVGWQEGSLDILLNKRPRVQSVGKLCITAGAGGRVALAGEAVEHPARVGRRIQRGRISLTAISKEKRSTLQVLPKVFARIGRGNASFIGPWTVWLIAFLLAASGTLAAIAVWRTLAIGTGIDTRQTSRRSERWWLRVARRVPLVGALLTGASLSLGIGWALLTPPFQVPDETAHVAYVQYLAETGRLPTATSAERGFSPEQNAIMNALSFQRVVGRQDEKVISTDRQEHALRSVERQSLTKVGTGNAATASPNPPLYYLMQALVYRATAAAGLLTQILAMRLLSVAFTSMTVLLSFLFVRELIPNSPWTWTVGGLAVAFQPLLGFIGAGVNPDSLLFLSVSGVLLMGSRMLRRGLTQRRSLALGAFVLAGLLTKPLFLSILPAALVALAIAALRLGRTSIRPLIAFGAMAVVPMAAYFVLTSTVWDHPYFNVAASVAGGPVEGTNVGLGQFYTSRGSEVSFLLQEFLPRMPFLTDFEPGVPLRDVWVRGLAGVFGWLDYGFGDSALRFASWLVTGLVAAATLALAVARRDLRRHAPLMMVSLVALVGLLGAIGITDYHVFVTGGDRFQQGRYLLPAVALYGGLFALAAKGCGRRAQLIVVPSVCALVCFHTLAAVLLTINRYYV